MAIQTVLVDGNSAPFSFEKGFLKLEIQADYPNQVLNIDIVDQSSLHSRPVPSESFAIQAC